MVTVSVTRWNLGCLHYLQTHYVFAKNIRIIVGNKPIINRIQIPKTICEGGEWTPRYDPF